ncbi:MAG: acyltransferase, partial [Candidatus Thorarchaeota archaeon]|nr:acyltransferase [Candidatus Thorarchaeota archaeon]
MTVRNLRVGLVQAKWDGAVTDEESIEENIEKMIQKHEAFAAQAKKKEVQILCFQELFYGPYFCAEQNRRWYKYAQPIPGPLTERMCNLARKNNLVLIVPMYEEEMAGIYYNTAIIINSDGSLLGKMRKMHIP